MTNIATIRRILYDDPVWSAYAIADLQPAVVDACSWALGEGSDGRRGVVMTYCNMVPQVVFACGPADAVAHALEQVELDDTIYVSVRNEHEPVISRWFDISQDRRPMYRMVLRRAEQIDVPVVDGLVRLHADDAVRLRRLYDLGGHFAPDAFDPWQLGNGVFYGIEGVNGELDAAGGTHIVDWDAGIGAIGNFYTRPSARRKGLGSALLAAIVRDLSNGYVDTIVLNVDQRNIGASQLYQRHGFVVHCPFVEGVAVRNRVAATRARA